MATAVYQDNQASLARRKALAAKLFAGRSSWSPGRRIDNGRPLFVIPGTVVRHKDGTIDQPAYYTDQHDCNCDSRRFNHGPCKHMLAVRLWIAAWMAGSIKLPARYSQRDGELLREGAGLTDELDIADQADRLLWEYDNLGTPQQEKATAWWAGTDGAPVWLKPEDTFQPDSTESVPASVREPAATPADTDPRDPSKPFPSHLDGPQRTRAMLEAFDAGWMPELTPEDIAEAEAYEAALAAGAIPPGPRFSRGYDDLYPTDPLEET